MPGLQLRIIRNNYLICASMHTIKLITQNMMQLLKIEWADPHMVTWKKL